MRKLLEQGLVKKVNGDHEGAKQLLDQYITERASVIYGKLRNLQDVKLTENFLEELYSRDIFEEDEEETEVTDDFMSDGDDFSEEETKTTEDDATDETDENDVSLEELNDKIDNLSDLINNLVDSFEEEEIEGEKNEDLADLAQNDDSEEEIDLDVKDEDGEEEDVDMQIEGFLREFEEVKVPKGNEEGLTSDGKKIKVDTKSDILPNKKVGDRVGGKPITIVDKGHKGFDREQAIEKPKGSFTPNSKNQNADFRSAKPVTTDKEGVGADGSKVTSGPTNKGPIAGK